jgi:alcohol oxidase
MKRLENYQKPTGKPELHGYDGPIAISNGGTITALAQDFLRASDAIGVPFSGAFLSVVFCKSRQYLICLRSNR